MADIMQRIDKLTDEIIIDLMAQHKIKSKKEIINKCVQFCFANNINLLDAGENFENLSTLNLYKNFKKMEFGIMKKLENLPFDLKKIIDSDDEFHPFFENYDFMIKKYDAFLNRKDLNDDFKNYLSEEESAFFDLSKQRIAKY